MKKFILMLSCVLLSIFSYSQTEYPRYETDSLGQKVITMTIEQAQKLDNNSDLLALFEKLNVQFGQYDTACIKAVNDKNIVISTQKMEIKKLKDYAKIKDEKIVTLQKEIDSYLLIISSLNKEIAYNNQIISEKNKQIGGFRKKMIIGGVVGGGAILGLLYLLLLGL